MSGDYDLTEDSFDDLCFGNGPGDRAKGAATILAFVPATPDPTSKTAQDRAREARGQEHDGSGDWDPRGRAGDTEDARASDTSKRKTPPTGKESAGKRNRPGAREGVENRAEPRPQPADDGPEEPLRACVDHAVEFILRARNPHGAWRYDVPPTGDNPPPSTM